MLSARLSAKVKKALRCKIVSSFHWTDSTIVLGWLSSQACDLQTFVANRVGEIQELTGGGHWRHVPGDNNPADLASRGVNPNDLQSAALWWEGPSFLSEDPCNWPQNIHPKNTLDLPERKSYSINLHTTTTTKYITNNNIDTTIINFDRYSNFTRLHRATAYVLRFIFNIRNKNNKLINVLSSDELQAS